MATTTSNSSSVANRSGLDTNYRLFLEQADTALISVYCGKDPTNSERDDLLLGSKVGLNMLDCVEYPNSHSVFSDNAVTNCNILIHLRFLGY
jgi:hypothetical protein